MYSKEAIEMERVVRLMPLGDLSYLKRFLSICNARGLIEKVRIIEVVRSFSGSLRGLEQEFIDKMNRDIQMIIARKAIDEVGIKNARFIQVFSNSTKINEINILTFLKHEIRCNGKIFLVHPFKIELCWNRELARLFGCDCAEHVLPNFEKVYSNNNTPRNAIEVSRLFALDKASWMELHFAWIFVEGVVEGTKENSEDDIWNKALSAAFYAAKSAAESATVGEAIIGIINKISWSAVKSSGWRSNSYKEKKEEHEWQIERLLEYLLGERTIETERKKYSNQSI